MKIGSLEVRRNKNNVPPEKMAKVYLEDILSRPGVKYEGVTDSGAILVSETKGEKLIDEQGKQFAFYGSNSQPQLGELGYTGSSIWFNLLREDYNPQMRGSLALRKYDEMRRNDAMVRASLRLMKAPVLAARWFVQPATMNAQDVEIASFVENNLRKWMTISWQQVLIEALLCLDFGYFMFEKVFDFHPDGSGKIIWKKLAPRHPIDVVRWEYDDHGGPQQAWFYDPTNAEGIPIPISKLLVMTFDREAGNLEGISVLRSAYKHWYFKEQLYKIDAIQKERHGIGIPVIKLPPNFNQNDKKIADQLGSNLRTNEKAHIVLPPNWDVEFAELKGQPTNAMDSIVHHNQQIALNVMGMFLDQANVAQAEDKQEMFLKATRFVAENIRDVFNKHAIPQLVDYNWPNVEEYPTLKVRRIGDAVDWQKLSFAIRNFIGAGVIVPDEALEEWVRDEMDMPGIDPDTARVMATPQLPEGIPGLPEIPTTSDEVTGVSVRNAIVNRGKGVIPPGTQVNQPGRAGLPRQSQARNIKKGPGGSNVGKDSSGNRG